MLQVEAVVKSFDDFKAVNGAHLTVEKGEIVAATRAIPLIISEETLIAATQIAEACDGIFSVKPLSQPETGLVITGNEVFNGIIEDKFAPILKTKLRAFGCTVRSCMLAPDDRFEIAKRIEALLLSGVRLILVAGGMSVDPDDVSRMAIEEAGAEEGTLVMAGSPVYGQKVPGMKQLMAITKNEPQVTHYIRGYVSMMVLTEALKRADKQGKITGESVKTALESLKDFDTHGLTPEKITFSATDHRPHTTVNILEFQKGKLVLKKSITLPRKAEWLGL